MKSSHLLRRRLALTTILTVLPVMGYGRAAYAACVANPAAPAFLCSGANVVTQVIDADNADVTTAPDFSVNAAVDNGITITGDGALKFTDGNGSIIKGAVNGLYVYAKADDGAIPGSVTIATNGAVTGGNYGIFAKNKGTGTTSITADGDVTGIDRDGLYARDYAGSGDMTIITGANSAVTSGDDGIDANNAGGNLLIAVRGDVTGADGGIDADNQTDSVDMTIATDARSRITGLDSDGINAQNRGSGNLSITIGGSVAGRAGDGIDVESYSSGVDMSVTTGVGSVVVGRDDGIDAEHEGTGNLKITVDGEVSGAASGIRAYNNGDGYAAITVGVKGVVQGETNALYLSSDDGQDIIIVNDGVIRNASGAAGDMVIDTEVEDPDIDIGAIDLTNNGILIGRIKFGNDDDHLINRGRWATLGDNQFGDGFDQIENEGVLIAAGDAARDEFVGLFGLDQFINTGVISLVDGGATDALEITGDYVGGGVLAVDVVLGAPPDGKSDILLVGGNVDGVTRISVNVLDAIGASIDGITVVEVDGATDAGDFVLKDGPINAGFFTWDLRFDAVTKTHELFTLGIGVGAYEFAAGITGTQEIWHLTTGTLAQRQADLRPLLAATQVTPVADFSAPVAPTAAGRVGPGFWFSALGGYLERDAEQDGFVLDRTQSIYGGLAGFDIATERAGETWLFGLFGGYVGSTLTFSESNTKWNYDGPTIGAYATYLNAAFYADVTVKADFLSIAIDPDDVAQQADNSDTDAVNLGGRIDTGYKFGGADGIFVEPQATLAVVNSDIDESQVYGGTVDFDNETSVKGRLGLRLGYDHAAGDAVIYSADVTAGVWQEFNDSNDVSVTDTDFQDFGVSDTTVETAGDISLGFGVTAPEGWSGFLRGNYQFAEDFDAIAGNAGLRYVW